MAPAKVLIADDDASTRESLRELLDLNGHQTETAPDGACALAALLDGSFDVAILDIAMPQLSGWQVAEAVRDRLAGRKPGLIALTVLGRPEDRERSRAAGFDAHLVKPVPLSDLLEEVGRLT